MSKKIIGYKAFNKDMTCRGFQYEEGKTYKMDNKPDCCNEGFHFCEYPLDCFNYYEPTESVFHKVEGIGDFDRKNDDDTKVATNKMKIGARLSFKELIDASIEFTLSRAKKGGKGANKRTYSSVASNTGDSSVAKNTGKNGISSNLGINGQASGKIGTWLVLVEWIECGYRYEIKEVKTVLIDGERIKEDKYYSLENGEFVEKGNE
jgi:hypothetical protein